VWWWAKFNRLVEFRPPQAELPSEVEAQIENTVRASVV